MEKRVMVVSDDLRIRELFYDLLSVRGYKIITIPRRQDIMNMLKKESPSLILLDIEMNDLDGRQILRKIREFDSRTRIIVLTSGDEPELDKQVRLSGATGLLKKSCGLFTISKIVSSILEERLESVDEDIRKILLVEDDLETCALTSNFLIKRGFKPIIANTGEEALEKIKLEKPIIVLLDINMPGMDGLITLRRIKRINESLGIIIITGMADENMAEETRKLGVYDYILKPVEPDYLLFCIISKILLLTT